MIAALDGRVSGELTRLRDAVAAGKASKAASLAVTRAEEVDDIEKTYG